MFEKYGPKVKKNIINKIVLPSNFIIVWENLVQIGSLVTEIQNLGGNIFSISYINLFKRKNNQYEKKFIKKIDFNFTSVYQFLSKSIHCSIYSSPFLWCQNVSGWIFTWGQIKYAEVNVSAKVKFFIRDIKVWLIFAHNSSDYI